MQSLFSSLSLTDVRQDVMRNIVSIRISQDLFDDLSDDPDDWKIAQDVEDAAKPFLYRSDTPVIHRPFEDAAWMNAIEWPFRNWQQSRFSDGSFGVWYGGGTIETTVHETAYHWHKRFLTDAGFENLPVIGERKIYSVSCEAALLDLRHLADEHRDIFHSQDYVYAQAVGARIHREGHPGLVCPSVRDPQGENFVIMNSAVLSRPRFNCCLTYRLQNERIVIEKQPGVTWFEITPTV